MISSISLDITNHCNFDCVHCLRDKLASRGHMDLDLLEGILAQASSLGIRNSCLTGGEVSLHPRLADVLDLHVKYGLRFNMVSNGYLFLEKVLPLLRGERKGYLDSVCFSLDGARPRTHDLLRQKEGSFRKTLRAIKECVREGIRVSVKSAMYRGNLEEIGDVAFLCASLGVEELGFIVLTPTPRLLEENLMPSPEEYRRAIAFVKGRIIPSFTMEVRIEGYADSDMKIPFCNPVHSISVDHEGNLIFCCNLSHPTGGGGEPHGFGREFLGNIGEVGLERGLVEHYRVWGWFVEKALELGRDRPVTCTECLELFGKTKWRKGHGGPHHQDLELL